MKAILRSDFYHICSFGKFWLGMCVIMTAIGVFKQDSGYLFFYPTFFAIMLPYSLASLDESTQWQTHLLSMPLTRTRLVLGRYLIIILFIVPINLFCLICALLIGQDDPLSTLSALAVCGAVSLFASAVVLPFIYRFGSNKARFVIFFLFIIPFLLVSLSDFDGVYTAPPAFFLAPEFPFALCTIALLLFCASAAISVLLVRRRDF